MIIILGLKFIFSCAKIIFDFTYTFIICIKHIKLSYSCTKNIKSIINSHNIKGLHQNRLCPNEQKCNCIKKEFCPLNGNCQAENTVYEATITYNEQTYGENIYIGIAETTFKKRYSNHKSHLI